ncbi:MAG: hypothetical protein KJ936_01280 [Proteobacteria bacterium]|nr:hypothetical protein [Pseudomonadota bacterium]MBU2261518.1 hypothetical protein [Pseudomonadota bacterium]
MTAEEQSTPASRGAEKKNNQAFRVIMRKSNTSTDTLAIPISVTATENMDRHYRTMPSIKNSNLFALGSKERVLPASLREKS